MIVLVDVPLRPLNDLLVCFSANHHFILIYLSRESSTIDFAHLSLCLLYQSFSPTVDLPDERPLVRGITYTLEESDTLLSFKLFQFAKLLDESLFVHRQFDAFEVV